MHTLRILYLSIYLSLFTMSALAQTTIVTDSTPVKGRTWVIAGKEFDRSKFHEMTWGAHYREEWSTPVNVPDLMLDTAKGGLKVLKESGSRQTKGLRLKAPDGKEYVLRSINKDFGNGLDEIYQGTMVSQVAKDQSSIGHPFAAPPIAYMIARTGIYHTNPVIVFVPAQPALGTYNQLYGNQLYLFEERPDEDQHDVASFGNSNNVIGTEKMLEHIYEDHDKQVDQAAYARARLFDMFIGDWSRHEDQWRWASFRSGDKTIYKPIPRDRDQAFTRFDGIMPWFATSVFGAGWLESFDGHLNKTKRFNKPAYQLDKMLLNELTREDWVNEAISMQNALTDEVIETGIKQMPPEIFRISGDRIINDLKQRRNELQQYAVSYYTYLSHHADIHGTKKKELFVINRINDEETDILISDLKKDGSPAEPFYQRRFLAKETKEIRIYSLDGADEFRMNGQEEDGVKIRIVDESGNDRIPFNKGGKNKISVGSEFEYDTMHQKKFDFFFLPFLSPKEYIAFANDPLDLFTRTGLKVSANIRYNTKPWRKDEYENIHLVSANYGFLRSAFNIAYVGRFQQMVGKWDFMLKLRADIPAQENFFGIGNDTKIMSDERRYYNVKSRRFYTGLGLSRIFNEHHSMEITGVYQSVNIESEIRALTKEPELADPDHFRINRYAGLEANYTYTDVDEEIYPTRGIRFSLSGGYLRDIRGQEENFGKIRSEVSGYLPLSGSITLASRVGAGFLSGKANYYHLNILGGNENLRGYPRERFYGKSVFYNNNELRWLRPTRNFFFNGRIGLFAFMDNGRVWQPGEVSDTWHFGYGGGVILVPFNRISLTGSYGRSKEGYQLTALARVFF